MKTMTPFLWCGKITSKIVSNFRYCLKRPINLQTQYIYFKKTASKIMKHLNANILFSCV